MTAPLRGILPAAVTPVDDRGRFSRESFERLLQRLYQAGSHGVYVCGTTGEGVLQSVAQREAIVEAAVASTPAGRLVVVHVGAASLDDTLRLSAHAARAGAHAVSSLPPHSGMFSFADVHGYYRALAAASDLPLLLYYFPELTASISSGQQLAALCELPNVAGVKFTDFDLYTMSQVAQPGRSVFNGRDEVLAAGLLMGADGGIGTFYNLVPELFVAIYEAANAGRWAEAREIQKTVNALVSAVLEFPLFPAVKQLLGWSGLDCGPCLPPRRPLTLDQQQNLRERVTRAGFPRLAGQQ